MKIAKKLLHFIFILALTFASHRNVMADNYYYRAFNYDLVIKDFKKFFKVNPSCSPNNTLFFWDLDDTLVTFNNTSFEDEWLPPEYFVTFFKKLNKKFEMYGLTSRPKEMNNMTLRKKGDDSPFFQFREQKNSSKKFTSKKIVRMGENFTNAIYHNGIYYVGYQKTCYLKGQFVHYILSKRSDIQCVVAIDDDNAQINSYFIYFDYMSKHNSSFHYLIYQVLSSANAKNQEYSPRKLDKKELNNIRKSGKVNFNIIPSSNSFKLISKKRTTHFKFY